MAKSRGRPKTERDDATIRVSRPIASKLKAIANGKGVTVGDVVDDLFNDAVDKAYAAFLRGLEGKK